MSKLSIWQAKRAWDSASYDCLTGSSAWCNSASVAWTKSEERSPGDTHCRRRRSCNCPSSSCFVASASASVVPCPLPYRTPTDHFPAASYLQCLFVLCSLSTVSTYFSSELSCGTDLICAVRYWSNSRTCLPSILLPVLPNWAICSYPCSTTWSATSICFISSISFSYLAKIWSTGSRRPAAPRQSPSKYCLTASWPFVALSLCPSSSSLASAAWILGLAEAFNLYIGK